jgi:2-iminobutanoate/2-iminopropanoate deaminase
MKKAIISSRAPQPIGPYNQAILKGDTLYMSGQIAMHPDTNVLVLDNIQSETHQVMTNIKAVLEAAEMGMEHIVKTTIFLRTMEDFAAVNEIYATYFKNSVAPARETVAVVGLPKNVNIEISAIAVR